MDWQKRQQSGNEINKLRIALNIQLLHLRLKRSSIQAKKLSGARLVPADFLQHFDDVLSCCLAEVFDIFGKLMKTGKVDVVTCDRLL